jgi:hypothetical protein
VITDASWQHPLIGVCGGDIGLGDTQPNAHDFNTRVLKKPAYRNRASPDLDWDLDEQ